MYGHPLHPTMILAVAALTLNSPPAVGGFSSNTFSINTYSTYSAIYLYILDSNSLKQAFEMAYSTFQSAETARGLFSVTP